MRATMNRGHRGVSKLNSIRRDGVSAPSFAERKPLTQSRSEKHPTLNVQSATNSLSPWPTRAIAALTGGMNGTIQPQVFSTLISETYWRRGRENFIPLRY